MESATVIYVMGGFFLFVVMPAIIAFASYHEKKLDLQRELARSGGEEMQVELTKTLAELARMRERMAVLERLVTDDDRRVEREIEKLRRDPISPPA